MMRHITFLATVLAWTCFGSSNAMAQDSLRNLLQDVEREHKDTVTGREEFSRQRTETLQRQRPTGPHMEAGNFTCRFNCIAPGFTGGPNTGEIVRKFYAENIGDARLKAEDWGSKYCSSLRRDTTLHKNQGMTIGHTSCDPTQ